MLALVIPLYAMGGSGDLVIDISLESQNISSGDAVDLTIMFSNRDTFPIRLAPPRFSESLDITIVCNGTPLAYHGPLDDPLPDAKRDLITIAPGSSVYMIHTIHPDRWGLVDGKEHHISVHYMGSDDSGPFQYAHWEGESTAGPITLNVI